jgi:metal-sulfur cluster biosynthetic enzyme
MLSVSIMAAPSAAGHGTNDGTEKTIDGTRRDINMKEKIIEQLKTVYDPEITTINIFDLGLVYDIDIKDKDVTITHTLTSMFCPMADEISASIKQAVKKVEGVGEVQVKLTHTPPFTKEMMSEDAKLALGLW